jgi:hypothetical protein
VIDRVADGVRQRIADGFEQTLVQFRFLAFHLQPHLLAEAERQIAHQAREPREDMVDRLHTRLHDRFAQVRGNHIEPAAQQGEARIGAGGLQNLIAREHQLAHQVHHAVQQLHVHAQRGVRRAARRGRL